MRLLAGAVLLLGLALAFGGALAIGDATDGRTAHRFTLQVDRQVGTVEDGLERYEDVLVAERAWLTASGRVTRGQFADYARATDFARRQEGMQGLGFQAYVPGSQRDAFVAQARRDGPADFDIVPPGRRAAYYVVLYNEPAASFGKTWGSDARSNPTIRPFLERARDTGRTTLSGRAVLGVDLALPKAQQPVAFGMFVPVYRSGAPTTTVTERRRAFVGWASSPFRAPDFLAAVDGHRPGITLALYDGPATAENLIAGTARSQAAYGLVRSVPIRFGGRTLTLRAVAAPGVARESHAFAWAVGVGGAVLALIVSGLLWVLGSRSAVVRDRNAAVARLQDTVGELELLGAITTNMAEGVCLVRSSDRHIIYCNPRFEQLFGYGPGEALGQNVAVLNAPSTGGATAIEEEVGRALAETGGWSGELHNARKDGTELWCLVNLSNMEHAEHGTISVAVHTDISEQRQMTAELRRERAALARAQAIGGVGSWEWALGTQIPIWSDEQFRLHGVDPAHGAPAFEAYLEMVVPEDRDALAERMSAHMSGTREFAEEYRITHPTLGRRTLRLHGDVLAAEPEFGQPPRLAGTTQDVTDERAAHAALQTAEERFRCAFDEASVGMLIIGLDGRYERVNDAFCAIVGYTQDALIGLTRASITHPDDLAADQSGIDGLLAGARTSTAREKRYLHASGHPVWAAINLTLIRDADGEPVHFIAQVQDITERRRYEQQLQHMADHDPLTGLLNRRSFERELDGHIDRIARYGPTGAVLMLDLDNFKYFNDTQGHNAGDRLIVRIAQSLRTRLRDSDVLARLGGDEFAILLPEGDEATTRIVADALLELVGTEEMPAVLGDQRRVTASIGIARFDDGERLTAEEVMVNADLAMYDAKEAGRGRWARYRTDEHERPKIESRMKWAEEIDHALQHDGFELLAQPIVPLGTNGPAQYELLLRMRNRVGDLIPPASFLYVAERLGLIGDIDRWVTDRAITMLADQRAVGHDLRFEVNLSGHTIGDEQLLALVERRLAETGVPPDRLIFEVTETAAVANMARAAVFAERLTSLGCKFALDDFGAGFGSFYYLKHLPFDYLKIDGEFVRNCADNPTDRLLISAVVQIARGMGKRTIAEFVTDEETVEVLTGLGVDYGQGYHLGRPAPLAEHLAALTVGA